MIRSFACALHRRVSAVPLALALALTMTGTLPAAFANDAAPRKVHQLRIYEIFDDTAPQFHARFRDHAIRIMRRYDFPIVATWESRGEDRVEFVYLLEWSDEATMRDRWAKFMADEEWARIKRETRAQGRMVGGIEDRTLILTDYSPRAQLLPPP
jgi:hypothetical protein